jgi:hypothetical protein
MAAYVLADVGVRFAVPSSVEETCSLDDSLLQREMGLRFIESDKRGRAVFEGSVGAFVAVIDTVLHMAADHGDEDPAARNARAWAKREGARAVADGLAKWTGTGIEAK